MGNLLDDPVVEGFVVSARDITARVAVELELRKTLSLLTATLDSTADGILVVDMGGRFTSFNARFVEMWRVPEAILAARDDAAATAFGDRAVGLAGGISGEGGRAVCQSRGRVERHRRVQRRSSVRRLLKATVVDGAVVGRVWSFRDVTERRRTEQELRESEQQFRQVFNQGPLGIALVDLDARIIDANRALCRFVGARDKSSWVRRSRPSPTRRTLTRSPNLPARSQRR